LQDEYGFDANPPPGTEMLGSIAAQGEDQQDPLELAIDYGSGSGAEDGRREILEDRHMAHEDFMLGSAAMYGPTEIGFTAEDEIGLHEEDYAIGAGQAADRPATEIGNGYIAKHGPSEIGYGPFSERGATEIGNGYIAKHGPSEIGYGPFSERGATEIGHGHYAQDGAAEIGADVQAPFESFMLDDVHMGRHEEDYEIGCDEVGSELSEAYAIGIEDEVGFGGFDQSIGMHEEDYAIGAGQAADRPATEIGAAIVKVIEKARDNRQPAPPMKAVDVDAPVTGEEDWGLTDVMIGATIATAGPDPFPLTSALLLRAGATTEPRIVRVDTEASYRDFRAESSPEMAALKARLEDHVNDPHAHGGIDEADVEDDVADLVHLGAAVDEAEAAKRVELVMPRHFDGMVTAWREGNSVCASLSLPGRDGEVRICTSIEPIAKCLEEMSRHAAESGVPASAVVGALPSMGCVLGAATALKEMAAAAPAILQRPEAGMKLPFMVRIEPKLNPAIAALTMLAAACKAGSAQACAEWQKLGEMSAGPVKQAMAEAIALAKAAA
jgi:hypothetical protein